MVSVPRNCNEFLRKIAVKHPIISAPMFGASTPQLVAAVSNAGGLGMLPGGQSSKAQLQELIRCTKTRLRKCILSDTKFGVNLFVPRGFHLPQEMWRSNQKAASEEALRRQVSASLELSGAAKAEMLQKLGSTSPSFESVQRNFSDQLDALIEERVSVASFHFGWPSPEEISKLKEAEIYLIGLEAGGHRGTFLNAASYKKDALLPTGFLTKEIVKKVKVPVISAGGIMDGADITEMIAFGASAAQLGTAFLTTQESCISHHHTATLLKKDSNGKSPNTTVITQGFTGKPVRAIENSWANQMQDIESELPNGFNALPAGRSFAAQNAELGRPDLMYLCAGQNFERCRAKVSAQDLMLTLVREMRDAGEEASLHPNFPDVSLTSSGNRARL